jgi:NOL1/NOP2/fmu family ribosome biogenesis protein
MQNCIDLMQKMPNFKAKVWDKISHLHSQIEEEKGTQGIAFGEQARQRLRLKKNLEEK